MNPAMHALSLYLDTSVIGGYYYADFMADTRALWLLKAAGRFRFVSSVIVYQEIARAPEPDSGFISMVGRPSTQAASKPSASTPARTASTKAGNTPLARSMAMATNMATR